MEETLDVEIMISIPRAEIAEDYSDVEVANDLALGIKEDIDAAAPDNEVIVRIHRISDGIRGT